MIAEAVIRQAHTPPAYWIAPDLGTGGRSRVKREALHER
jgi:hypothetical protein